MGIDQFMKAILATIAVSALVAVPASATAKSPLEGRWKSGSMVVEIGPCGGSLCGTVVKASSKQKAKAEHGSGTDLVGARLITNIEPTGPRTYHARVFVADRDMYASGTIRQTSADQLNVKGCVLLGIICRSKNWARVN